MHNHPPLVANLNLIPTSPAWQEGEVKYKVRDVSTNHIKNATWPERWSPRNEKTRKRENQKTRKREHFLPFSRFRVSRCSHLRASSIASLIACSVSLLAANTAFLLSPFSGLRVFAVFGFSPFSPFSGFRRFRVVAVFAFSPFSRFRRFRVFAFLRFRVHRGIPFSRFRAFTCSVLAFSCYGMDCVGTCLTHVQSFDNVTFVFIVLRNGLLRHILYNAQSCAMTFAFKVLQKVLLRYITYKCPKR